MITPEIKPGELAQGYEGRLLYVNPELHQRSLRQAIAAHFGLTEGKPLIFYLATAAEIDLTAFVRSHTIIPFQRIAVKKRSYQTSLFHGDPNEVNLLRQLPMVEASSARFCRACVAEDLTIHSLSYWRRAHQLPGVDWCPKHRIALTEIKKAGTYLTTPSHHLDTAHDLKVEPLEIWPVLQRYLTIAVDALEFERPLCCTDIGHALGARAGENGLRVAEKGKRPLLSDLALRHLPPGWIRRHLPALADKPSGTFCNVLDASCRSRSGAKSLTYALALALLFPSADQALQLVANLHDLDEPAVTKPEAVKRYDAAFWASEQLRALYVQCKGCHQMVARELCLSLIHVRTHLNARRLPSLENVRDLSSIAAALDFKAGASLDAAIKGHSANKAQTEHWLRQDLYTLAPILKARLALL